MAIKNTSALVSVNELTKSIDTLRRFGKTITNITITYSLNLQSENMRLDEIIYEHCRDTLTQITIKNGHKHSLVHRQFPKLFHLTFVGNIAESSAVILLLSNPQLEIVDLECDVESIHKFLFNFKMTRKFFAKSGIAPKDCISAENTTLRFSVKEVQMNEFNRLTDSLSFFLKDFQRFELRGSFEWSAKVYYVGGATNEMMILAEGEPIALSDIPTKCAKKITYIVKDIKKWPSYDLMLRSGNYRIVQPILNFFHASSKAEVVIKLFVDSQFSSKMIFNLIKIYRSKSYTITLYYEVNRNMASINEIYLDLCEKLHTKFLEWKVLYDSNGKFFNAEFKIDFKGASITLLQ